MGVCFRGCPTEAEFIPLGDSLGGSLGTLVASVHEYYMGQNLGCSLKGEKFEVPEVKEEF